MILYIGLAVVTVALAAFVNNRFAVQQNTVSRQQMCNRILTGCIFTLLFSVSACRIAVGNDYWEYTEAFSLIAQNRHVSMEIGFNLVVRAVQFFLGLGKPAYLTIFGIFSFGTVYFMLRAIYEQSEWFACSVFLFMTGGYYFSGMTSVRYYFVLAIALYSMKYVLNRQWGKFLFWILFAAFFHKSVLFVIPVYWLASRNWKKWHMVFAVVLCGTFLVFQDVYRKIVFYFYPFYENSVFDNGETSLMNILKCACVLVLSLLYYKAAVKDRKEVRFYFFLNLGALMLYVFCPFIPEISRVGYYLNVTNIFLIPAVLIRIPDKKQRIFFAAAVAVAFCLYFALFLRSAYDVGIRLLPYRNWIFQ